MQNDETCGLMRNVACTQAMMKVEKRQRIFLLLPEKERRSYELNPGCLATLEMS